MLRIAFFVAFVGVAAGAAVGVQAHGRFPVPNGLVFHPTDPDFMVVRSTRGLLVTSDGGASWHWMCLEVAEASSFGREDPSFAMMGDGSLVASTGLQGVVRSDPTWCTWSEAVLSEDMRYFVIDQARHPVLPNTTFVVTSSGTPTVNGVYRSDDGGHTWAPTREGGIDAVFFESIAVAPSDPDVIYLTAVTFESTTRQGHLYVSRDGGESWADPSTPIALHEGERLPIIAGVDPTDPDRVFVRIMHDDFLFDPPLERLLLSEDGGESFETVHTAPHIRSFAMSTDGMTAWAGDDGDGGLWRSDNAGVDFEAIDASIQVHCLEWHDGRLWMCANDFREGFAVARSDDLGETFTPFFAFDDVQGMHPCPGDGLLEICVPSIICDALPELGLNPHALVPEAECPGGDGGGVDAGTGADAGEANGGDGGGGGAETDTDGGCNCSVPTAAGGPGAAAMLGLPMLLWITRRSRRGRRRGAGLRTGSQPE
jgi:MYXO-CTERM domain-containing protein